VSSVNNRELEACFLRAATDAIVVDFQAPSEKQGVGLFCDQLCREVYKCEPKGRAYLAASTRSIAANRHVLPT
jgi:hypothetical protein